MSCVMKFLFVMNLCFAANVRNIVVCISPTNDVLQDDDYDMISDAGEGVMTMSACTTPQVRQLLPCIKAFC
jgi:hypothetical protein